ncbi:DUF6484 domain-containing protein [Candidatus Thiosymbion oneisti]|uniref:DUF6484 domain-containing protein n=1 Tax=Candidatus Thiosymbion oneisti TaxID=589554 RepID=UPI000A95E0AF|nr:DUF6484 domain-containing protein [Candidatus Thiosymbion oneisti]
MATNLNQDRAKTTGAEPAETTERYDGVIIGLLLGFHEEGAPLIAFPGNPQETALRARATTRLEGTDVGREVALLFEGGDPRLPLVIGVVQHPERTTETPVPLTADLDGERIELSAQKEIVLKCGKSSITLTRAGKILIRGAYLSSRSSGVNRIKGGSVQTG